MNSQYHDSHLCRNPRTKSLLLLLGIVLLSAAVIVSIVVASGTDTDMDGIPDSWEEFFGLNPTNSSDASANYDADALSNLEEYQLLTDPWTSDTDRDGWIDGAPDSNSLSRAWYGWGDPYLTSSNDYTYTWPLWAISAAKTGGEWDTNAPSWVVAASTTGATCRLYMDFDRELLTNRVVLKLVYSDTIDSTLYVDLLDAEDVTVASDLFGDLTQGTEQTLVANLDIPLDQYTNAVAVQLRRGIGQIQIHSALAYIDLDLDGLDSDQEAQLGTSDSFTDSDGDTLGDYAEVFSYSTDPTDSDSDNDSLSDGFELNFQPSALNPLSPDSDADGMRDADELGYGKDPTTSNTYSRIPFIENFESNTVTLGDINGQNGWESAPAGIIVVQTNVYQEDERALHIQPGTDNDAWVRNLFAAPTGSVIWADMQFQTESASSPTGQVSGAVCMYFTDGYVCAYDGLQPSGSEWLKLTNMAPVPNGEWVRLTASADYQEQTWLVCVNDHLVASGLGFATAQDVFSALVFEKGESFVDGVHITTTMPEGLFFDTDSLPEDWEIEHFGDMSAEDGGDADSDGLSNLQEYQAGTDPNVADSDNDGVDDATELAYGYSPASSNVFQTLPFSEGFETNTTTLGDLNGQNGWAAAPTDGTVVTTNFHAEGERAAAICGLSDEANPAHASHLFNSAEADFIWSDLYMIVSDAGLPETVTNAVAMVGFTQNGYLAVYDGSLSSNCWRVLTGSAQQEDGSWARLTIGADYASQTWRICLNGELAAADLGFAAPLPNFTALSIKGQKGGVDGITISTNAPSDIDADGDGMTTAEEEAAGTNPLLSDSDNDGMDDVDELRWGHSATTSNLYFRIDAASGTNSWKTGFEPEEGYQTGSLDGQQGWHASSNVTIVATQAYAGVQSAKIPPSESGQAEQMYADIGSAGHQQVWVSMVLQMEQGNREDLNPSNISSVVFMEDNRLHAYDGSITNWVASERTFEPDSNSWCRLDFGLDYSNHTYLVCVNGGLAVDGLQFQDLTIRSLAQIKIMSASGKDTFVDDICLSAAEPAAALDFDGDGLSNAEEYTLGTDPRLLDSDGDGLGDYDEVNTYNTDPADTDTDDDGAEDGWEIANGFDPDDASDGALDPDEDGLSNAGEFVAGTDPADADTDDDTLLDGAEVHTHGTSPLSADTDNDGMDDAWEVAHECTNPLVDDASSDPDGDRLTNMGEYSAGTDPCDADTDGDGMDDFLEVTQTHSDPLVVDFDGTTTLLASIDGSAVMNAIGTWTVEGTAIYARERSGSLDYALTIASNGSYAVEVDVTQHNPLTSRNSFDLTLSLDGIYCGRQTVVAPHGTVNTGTFFLPQAIAGTHTLGLRWRNLLPNTFLQVNALRLYALGGPDSNTNGTADWIDNRLDNVSSLDVIGETSLVSPVCIEGDSLFNAMLSIGASYEPEGQPQTISVRHGIGDGWFADVHLSPTNATIIDVTDQEGEVQFTNTVTWTALNLLDTEYTNFMLRTGDALALTAIPTSEVSGTVSINIDLDGNDLTNAVTDINTPWPFEFGDAGDYIISATFSNATVVTNATLPVRAVYGRFNGDPLCVIGDERTWDCPDVPEEAVIEHDVELNVMAEALAGGGASFTLMNPYDIPFYLTARLGQDGPIMDSAEAATAYTDNGTYWRVIEVYADGSRMVEVKLYVGYLAPDAEVRIHIFKGGVTFDDGTLNRVIVAGDLDELGVATFRLIQSGTSSGSVCHTTKVYQDGMYIGGL
ncbi:MAG: hypothetical protein HQ523_02335 [Lentisphaerae bacterium]|nr:hypothetical protein [Lentisphaerota bacterium]